MYHMYYVHSYMVNASTSTGGLNHLFWRFGIFGKFSSQFYGEYFCLDKMKCFIK